MFKLVSGVPIWKAISFNPAVKVTGVVDGPILRKTLPVCGMVVVYFSNVVPLVWGVWLTKVKPETSG